MEQVHILLVFLWVNLLLHCMPKKRHNFCHQDRQKVLSKWRCLIIRAANLGTEWINTTLVGCTFITLTSCVPANSLSIPESMDRMKRLVWVWLPPASKTPLSSSFTINLCLMIVVVCPRFRCMQTHWTIRVFINCEHEAYHHLLSPIAVHSSHS